MNNIVRVVGGMVVLLSSGIEMHGQVFYRVSGSTNSVITGLTSSGSLTWSNAAAQGTYLIEVTETAASPVWRPLTRGSFWTPAWTVTVNDPSTPEGMCFVPGGTFLMGDSQGDSNVFNLANPVHTVTVSPFFIDRYEFTNERMRSVLQWAFNHSLITVSVSNIVVSTGGSTNGLVNVGHLEAEVRFTNGVFSVKAGRANFPAEFVSWFGAVTCCNFLSAMTGREQCYDLVSWTCDFSKSGFRLPTEAEWELAARGGYEGLRFPWAETNVITHAYANYNSNTTTTNWYDVSPTRGYHPAYSSYVPRSSPVGAFLPNSFGLYDMAGNTWEWTWDWHSRYPYDPQTNPTGPTSGSNRIIRGGSWFTGAERLTCAMRYPMTPFKFFDDIGFRVALRCNN